MRPQRPPVRPRRPGAGEVVGRYDDRRHAVATASRPAGRFLLAFRRERFHPKLTTIEPAGKVAQQIKSLGQNVIAWHRLKLGKVERGKDIAQLEHAWTVRFAALTGRRRNRVARIEQNGATVFHISVDPLKRGRGGPGR